MAKVKLEKATKQLSPEDMKEKRTQVVRGVLLKERESEQSQRLEETAANQWKESGKEFASFFGIPAGLAAIAGSGIPMTPTGEKIGDQSLAAHDVAKAEDLRERFQSPGSRAKAAATRRRNTELGKRTRAVQQWEAVDEVKGAFSERSKEGMSPLTSKRIEGIQNRLQKVIYGSGQPGPGQDGQWYSLRKAVATLTTDERKALYERTVREFLRLGEKGAATVGKAGKRALAIPFLVLDFMFRTGPKQLLKNKDTETRLKYSALRYRRPLKRSDVMSDSLTALQEDHVMAAKLYQEGVLSATFYDEVIPDSPERPLRYR